jgi:hypothetical protein
MPSLLTGFSVSHGSELVKAQAVAAGGSRWFARESGEIRMSCLINSMTRGSLMSLWFDQALIHVGAQVGIARGGGLGAFSITSPNGILLPGWSCAQSALD